MLKQSRLLKGRELRISIASRKLTLLFPEQVWRKPLPVHHWLESHIATQRWLGELLIAVDDIVVHCGLQFWLPMVALVSPRGRFEGAVQGVSAGSIGNFGPE
ncbi:hypothetical protein GEU84_020540 [Fertoebacter nigrum]|uniref:Uncharacterized protein n=1 Tax=Fertoeibacter niger TaxID=2656921 RepID=A0A8X8H377_9RHOB|nr:hypothetical protein [Fertoeibacter niger]NUB46783.1 hypothetical protein [Fertoeibacter niger]